MGRGSVIGLSRERRGARDLHPLCLHSYIKFPIGNHQPYFVVTNGVLELCVCLFVLLVFHEQIVSVYLKLVFLLPWIVCIVVALEQILFLEWLFWCCNSVMKFCTRFCPQKDMNKNGWFSWAKLLWLCCKSGTNKWKA